MDARQNGLADIFVEWAGRAPDDLRSVLDIQDLGCFDLHGLHWQESFIASEGRHRLCHYRAPDAESVRIAFRQGGIEVDSVWSGTILSADGAGAPALALEIAFEAPFPEDAREAVERVRGPWLERLGLTLVRAVVPASRRRIICLCNGSEPLPPEAAALPAWSCRHVAPSP